MIAAWERIMDYRIERGGATKGLQRTSGWEDLCCLKIGISGGMKCWMLEGRSEPVV